MMMVMTGFCWAENCKDSRAGRPETPGAFIDHHNSYDYDYDDDYDNDSDIQDKDNTGISKHCENQIQL